MGSIFSEVGASDITVSAVVIRANGDREDLGVIAEYHANEEAPVTGFRSRPRVKAIARKLENVRNLS
jgi:hypothetical protein